MRLYESSIPSGNAYKVSLLLTQLGKKFDVTQLDILKTPSETREPAFLKKNPNGRVPVLELDEGSILAESNAILFYLGEGTRYLPEDRLAKARALQWMFFEQYSHEPYVAVLKFLTIWGDLGAQSPQNLERLKTRGQAALGVMATHLETNAFFTGADYGIADIALFAYTQSAERVGFDVPPSVKAWLTRVTQQPGYVAIAPH